MSAETYQIKHTIVISTKLRMIISSDEKVPKRMLELKHTLLKQKIYAENVIDVGIQRALNLNRAKLRQVRQNPEDNIVTYVSIFNSKNPEQFGAILQNVNILREDQIINDILQANTIIKSKRQPQNLK